MEKLLGDDFEINQYAKVDIIRLKEWIGEQEKKGATHVHFEASQDHFDTVSVINLIPMLIENEEEYAYNME